MADSKTPWTPDDICVLSDWDIWSGIEEIPGVPLYRANMDYRRWGRDLSYDDRISIAQKIATRYNCHNDLAAALEPFAKRASDVDENFFYDDENAEVSVTIGELRAARAALAKARGEA